MSAKDYYKILGLSPQADELELKKAYRQEAIKWHPDKNQGSLKAEARFKLIAEAYAVLSNPLHRGQYDMMGAKSFKNSFAAENIFKGFAPVDLFNLFGYEDAKDSLDTKDDMGNLKNSQSGGTRPKVKIGSFFKNFGQETNTRSRCGPDLLMDLSLNLSDIVFGVEKEIAYNTANGLIKHKVMIPPGAFNGQKLILKEKAPSKDGLRPGDLIVRLIIRPDPNFTRRGDDLETTIKLNQEEMDSGCSPTIRSLIGEYLRFTVPPQSQPGSLFRLAGYGLLGRSGRRGKLIIRLSLH